MIELFRSVRTDDVDDQALSLHGWSQCYRQLSLGTFQGGLDYYSLPDVELMFESSNQAVHQVGQTPSGKVVLGLPLDSEGEGWLAGRPFDRDSVIAIDAASQFSFRTPILLTLSAIIVDASVLMDTAVSFDMGALLEAVLHAGRARLPSGAAAPLRSCLEDFRDTLRKVQNPVPGSALRGMAASVLCRWLQALDCAERMELSLPSRRQQRERIVRSARSYILEHLAEIPTTLDVCRIIHVHERVLQYCFNEAMGMSPTTYIRYLRLHEVRRELRSGGMETLGDIAARWGFWHPSRFSSEYKQLFGELPSETRLLLRTTLA